VDDQMMLVQHRSGDRIMNYREFGQIFEANSVEQRIASRRTAGGQQEGGRAEQGGPTRGRQEGGR